MVMFSGIAILTAIIVVTLVTVALVFLALVIFGSKRGRSERPGSDAR